MSEDIEKSIETTVTESENMENSVQVNDMEKKCGEAVDDDDHDGKQQKCEKQTEKIKENGGEEDVEKSPKISQKENKKGEKKCEKKKEDKKSVNETGRLPSTGGFEIIGIKEKHGQLRKAVPTMPLPMAITLCLINVLLPGIGTLISSFFVFCGYKTEYESKGQAFCLNVTAAILQIITLPIIVGWIWSIMWGVTFITLAMAREEPKDGGQAPLPEDV